MSLVGFKAQNHVQQVGTRGPADTVDDRGTDPEFFAKVAEEFGPFTLDAAAAPHNAKCERYFTLQDDGLTQSWAGERVWCNPPYSNLSAWVRKAWDEEAKTRGVVMLVPANRCEQKWWQEHVEPFREKPTVWNGPVCSMCNGDGVFPFKPTDREVRWGTCFACNRHGREPSGTLAVRFLPGRLRFIKPGADSIGPNERPPFGCALLIWTAA